METRAELLAQAEALGLTIHPSSKDETIKAKIEAHKEALGIQTPAEGEAIIGYTNYGKMLQDITDEDEENAKDSDPYKEAMRMTKVIVTAKDPEEAAQGGVLMVVANSAFPTFKRFVPFNKPYMLEQWVLNVMKEKTYTHVDSNITLYDKEDTDTGKLVLPRYDIQVVGDGKLKYSEYVEISNRQQSNGTLEDCK